MRFYILKLGTYSSKTKQTKKKIIKEYLKICTKIMKEMKGIQTSWGKKLLPALDEFLKIILRVISYRISWNIKSWGHLCSDSSSKLQFYLFSFLVLAFCFLLFCILYSDCFLSRKPGLSRDSFKIRSKGLKYSFVI